MSSAKRGIVVIAFLTPLGVAPASLASENARIHTASRGQVLAAQPDVTPSALLADFLRSRGASRATTRSLRPAGKHRTRGGMVHLRLEQQVAGLRVHDAYVKAAFNRRGELVHVIEGAAPVPASVSVETRIVEAEALAVALQTLYPGLQTRIPKTGRKGNTVSFVKTDSFCDAPRVERVLIPAADASLAPGFLVETWSRDNELHETLVDGAGVVLEVERRTNDDSYNVFADHPGNSTQTVVTGPGAGNALSPAGWLFPRMQKSVQIAGNNVRSYLDVDDDRTPDAGGMDVGDGNFLAVLDASASPATPNNQDVAVQNLFYLGNLVHDRLYRHGFTETAGNFQAHNFGRGGHGDDPVDAEVQNDALMNNGKMSTPRDGRSPRMSMGLWTNVLVIVDAPAHLAGGYGAHPADFGPRLDGVGVTGNVVLVDDAAGMPTDACEAITNDVAGKIALIDRGNCAFTVKVSNAQDAGAAAVIVANDQGEGLVRMGGTAPEVTIHAVFVGQTDGGLLRSVAGVHATVRAPFAPVRDGALDSDIVWHEYGHGLTWRMIGGLYGPLGRAVGEGMSDVLAIVVNEDDAVSEYPTGAPDGLRRERYANYPRTYADITGAEPHDDGEVYGAIGWRLFEIFRREGLGKDLLLDYLVDGLNYTQRNPTFEDMRDGILAAVTNAGAGHECLIWEAFAAYGVGVGARGRNSWKNLEIEESFAMPEDCA